MTTDFDWIPFLAWASLTLSLVIAAVGTIAPAVPGAMMVVLGAVIHKLLLPDYLNWWVIFALGFLAILSFAADFLGTALGAKSGGASKYGIIGAAFGGLVGLIFFPVGLIVGPFVGAVIGEIISGRQFIQEIIRSGVGASLGFFISLILRLGILALMTLVLILDLVIH